ncbi:hypothetical protein TWF694_000992 [Orbilia ellipsospora]|uniref:Uncharacterized protein n=1 Tax=Orbilia ellipsospora TaxID=2528407 RepID=A0AAV9XQB7_9PEZI
MATENSTIPISPITERILQAADTHASLISQIAALEHAPPTLEQQHAYLQDLKANLLDLKKELVKLRAFTSKERKEHQDLRDSFARRYAHKLTGRSEKFVSKIEKEEREYLEAYHNQQVAEEKERYLEDTIAKTEKQITELTVQTKEYHNLKEKAKELYNRVFEGPTPDFPEEDQMELAVENAKVAFADAQSRYNADHEAQIALANAEQVVARAVGFADGALSASTWDLWGGGGLADFLERDNLSKAQSSLSQAQMFLSQAVVLQREIGPFQDVEVANGHIFSDIFFDNVFTDYQFHEKVKKTNLQVKKLFLQVRGEGQKQRARALDSKNNLGEAKAQLSAARTELENIRREVFERVSGVPGSIGVPPAYGTVGSPPPADSSETQHI